MKCAVASLFFLGLGGRALGESSPVSKVVQLLSDLSAKLGSDAEASKKLYTEYAAWCEDRAANLGFEIKTGTAQVEELKAAIDKEAATIVALTSKVEQLTSDIATDEADLKSATEIRAKEAADFAAEEQELRAVIDSLQRAINVLQREMRKGGAAMLQVQNAASIVEALSVMVEASMLNSADAGRLSALVQSSQQQAETDSDLSLGAPAAAVYASKSGSIVSTLEDLLDKAESQLAAARKRETADLHNFQLLKQSLSDEIKFATKDLTEAKQGIAASGESKSAAEGDLAVTSKDLAEDQAVLATLNHDCTTRAADYEAEVKSRDEELKALAEAKKIISENTAGAEELSYGLNQVSFVQVKLTTGADLAHFEAVRFVRSLAQKYNAPALAQLAARMATATEASTRNGQDPFAKVKGLISDMIARLEAEAGADASHKAYCDKELAETTANKEAKTTSVDKLSTKINQMSARSATLKEEVAALEKELALLAQSVAEQTQQRRKEHDVFVTEKANLEQGLQGVKLALKVLREYYGKTDKAHVAGEGTASSIVGLLEVVESDFTKGLAETVATEESAQSAFDQEMKESEVEKTAKQADVRYKTAQATDLDKAVAETTSDRSSVQAELDAVLEYLAKLEEQCIAKAEPYEERVQRRASEITGLKQALEILEGEAVLLQQTARRSLRGVRAHAAA
jgi:peptidoglycan hydrolase CwlO-like protein